MVGRTDWPAAHLVGAELDRRATDETEVGDARLLNRLPQSRGLQAGVGGVAVATELDSDVVPVMQVEQDLPPV